MATKTQPHSREFTPHGEGKRYLLDAIPGALWRRVRAKARRERVSVRATILRLLTEWAPEPSPKGPK